MLFQLIHFISVSRDGGRKEKSPIQELTRISHDLFESPCPIAWDEAIFGMDNYGVPLYISIQDVLDIIQGNQMINIACFQLWMM